MGYAAFLDQLHENMPDPPSEGETPLCTHSLGPRESHAPSGPTGRAFYAGQLAH